MFERYPFPTNLGIDQPIDSLNPESQAEFTRRALSENWSADAYLAGLDARYRRHQSG